MEQNMEIPEGEALERETARAYRVYQDNIRAAGELIYRLTRGARGGVPERELLETALEALDRCRIDGGEE